MDELDPYLEGQTRAEEWRALRQALVDRRRRLKSAREEAKTDPERAALDREIAALTKQIDTLQVEEVSSKFSEDALRFTIASSRIEEQEYGQ